MAVLMIQRPLTDKQAQLIELIGGGFSNAEIGEKLGIEESSVKQAVGRLLSRYQAQNRAHLYQIYSSGDHPASEETLLTMREACSILHVHSNTLRRWSDIGEVKAWRVGPRRDRRYRREDILKCLKR